MQSDEVPPIDSSLRELWAAVEGVTAVTVTPSHLIIPRNITLPIQVGHLIVFDAKMKDELVDQMILPEIKRKITRQPRKLPVSVPIPIPQALYQLIFGVTSSITLGEDDVTKLLRTEKHKVFEGSYAVVKSMACKYSISKGKAFLRIEYVVFNQDGYRQWPKDYYNVIPS